MNWYSRVPSKSNISDDPSRLCFTGLDRKGYTRCKPCCDFTKVQLQSGRHKPQSFIETKTLRFCNLIQKTSKNEPKHGPKNGTARSQKWDRLAVPFLGPHAQLSKKNKRKALPRSHFWDRQAVPKMRPQNRKIHSKGRPLQQTN